MKQTHLLVPTLRDLEKIRQAMLGNIEEVTFEFNDIILIFTTQKRLDKRPEVATNAKGDVSWLNQEH